MASPAGVGGVGGSGPPSAGPGGGGGHGVGGTELSALLHGGELKWEDTSYQLKDFASKFPMPNIVRVTKGQYRNIGVAKSVASELYLHSIKTSKKVLAEGVKVKDGKRIHTVDHKFSLPVTYQGWFELLSEDGKAIKPVLSVQELARVFPQRCLVRESVKCNLTSRDTGDVALDRTRVLNTGEQLSLAGEILVPGPPGSKGPPKRKMLKCFDLQGEAVFLGFEQKGMFSPIAGTSNISGVHNIKALLEKFRLPIIVRLVHGIIPSRLDKSSFTGVFRLLNVYSDETAFVCPMRRDAKMVPISTREPIKITATQNFVELQDTEEVRFYHMRCGKMIASYHNSIHVLVNPPDPNRLATGTTRGWAGADGGGEVFHHRQNQEVNHQPSSSPGGGGGGGGPHQHLPSRGTPPGKESNGVTEEDILFDEIDDIYQFVRDGGRPPPPRPRPPHLRKSDPNPMPASAMTNGTSSDQRPLSQGNLRASSQDVSNKFKRTGSKGELLGGRTPDQSRVAGVATAIISKTGSIDILNSSASASPEDTSPATTLSYHQKQEKDEHYWEEPIYEEISKYKKAQAAKNKDKAASTAADPGVTPSSSPMRSEAPPVTVENLRQMYKQQSPHGGATGTTPLATAGSRMSFAADTDDALSIEDLDEPLRLNSGPLGGRFDSPSAAYPPSPQNAPGAGFSVSATTSPITPNSTPERRASAGDSRGNSTSAFIKRTHADVALNSGFYHGGSGGGTGGANSPQQVSTPQFVEEFKSVHDRIASINRANAAAQNMNSSNKSGSPGAIGGGGVGGGVGGGASVTVGSPIHLHHYHQGPLPTHHSSAPEVSPGTTSAGVRRYVRATSGAVSVSAQHHPHMTSSPHGNAGRSHLSAHPHSHHHPLHHSNVAQGGPQFVAVARVESHPSTHPAVAASTRSSSSRGHPSSSSSSPQQGPSSNDHFSPTRDRPERHSERSPKTAYSRVENLRRKLQGLYL